MHMVERNFPGLVMLARLNFDRVFTIGTIIAGLLAGAFLGSAIVGHYSVPMQMMP